jgi:TolB-like protein
MSPKKLLVSALLLCLVSTAALAGARLDKGIEQYKSLDLQAALETFNGIAKDESAPKPERTAALRYIALCHLAMGKDHYVQAKSAVRAILSLDPEYKLDVDRSPKKMREYYFQATQEMGLFPPKNPPGIKTMAIIDFSSASIGEAEEGWGSMGTVLSSLLVTDLQGISKLRLVERERIGFLLDELKLQTSGKVDPETAVRVGKLVGAHAVCTGGLTRINDKLRIDVRLVSVETGEILLAEEKTGKTDEFFDLEKELAKQFAQKIDVGVTKAEMEMLEKSKAEAEDYESLKLYSMGLDHLAREQYSQARDYFEKALEANPRMELAEAKLEMAEQELFLASAY